MPSLSSNAPRRMVMADGQPGMPRLLTGRVDLDPSKDFRNQHAKVSVIMEEQKHMANYLRKQKLLQLQSNVFVEWRRHAEMETLHRAKSHLMKSKAALFYKQKMARLELVVLNEWWNLAHKHTIGLREGFMDIRTEHLVRRTYDGWVFAIVSGAMEHRHSTSKLNDYHSVMKATQKNRKKIALHMDGSSPRTGAMNWMGKKMRNTQHMELLKVVLICWHVFVRDEMSRYREKTGWFLTTTTLQS